MIVTEIADLQMFLKTQDFIFIRWLTGGVMYPQTEQYTDETYS